MVVKIDVSTLGLTRAAVVPGGPDSLVLVPVGYDLPSLPITATVNGVPIQNPTYVLDSRDPLSIQTSGVRLTVLKRTVSTGVWVRAVLQAGVNTGGATPTDSILVRAITKTVVTPRPTVIMAALKDSVPLLAYALGVPKASGAIDTILVPGFTWRSSNPAIATVDVNGRLASIGNGTTTIYAKSDFDSVAFTLTVKQQVAAWRLSQDTTSVVAIGDTGTVTATALDLRGQVVDTIVTNAQPSWTLTDPSLATLLTNGKSASMVALTNGSTALTAQTVTTDTSVIRFLGAGATQVKKVGQLRVSQVATSMLSVGVDSTTIEAPFLTFKFRARPLDRRGVDIVGGAAITWSSTNPAVARVDTSGTVEALTVGLATIKAQRDGAVHSFPVVVTNPPKTLAAAPKPISFVSLLDTARIIATVRNARTDTLFTAPVTFTSVDPAIATITPVGATGTNIARVQGVSTGTTRIIVTAAAGVVDTVVINVANIATQVTLSPRAITLASINDSTSPTPDVRNARGAAMSASVVTWVSRDPSIMTVTATGIVIAHAQGTATLVATSGTGGDSIPVTVTNARASVRLSPRGTVTFNSLPQTLTVKAATYNARGDTIPATAAATWTTSNATVASIATFSGDVVTLNINAVGTALLTATVPTGGGGTVIDTVRINATNSIVAIGLNPSGISFTSVGRTQQMIATATNIAGGTIPSVAFTWASSSPSVASVSVTGFVTALAPGSTNITASSGGQVGTAVVTVSSAPDTVRFTSIDTVLTSVGDSYQPGVVFKDAAGNVLARGTVSWGTTDTTVAKVTNSPTNPAGLVLATGIGSVRISASSAAASGPNDTLRVRSILVTVRNDPFLVTLNRTTNTLTALGQTLSYTATVTNRLGAPISNQAAGVVWSSSNPAIATVDASGLATAVDTGTMTITATTNVAGAATRTATATLIVTNSAASVTVTPLTFTISGATRTRQLSVAANNGSGSPITNPVVTWTSSAPLIATVSNTGLVTGLANGTATITATVNGVAGTATATVLAGIASAATSTITSSAATVTANGSSSAAITVQLKDINGNNLTTGSDSVGVFTSFGSVTTTAGGNGTYTASVTAATPGTAVITARVNGAAITTASPSIAFVPGPTSPLNSTLAVSSTNGVADGSTITITVQAKDASGNNRATAGDAVVITSSGAGSSIGTVLAASGSTNASGVYTTTISSLKTGSTTISATINGSAVAGSGNPVITYAPGAAAKLSISTQPSGAAIGAAFGQQPVVQVLDANNNLTTSTATVIAALASGGGTLNGTVSVAAVNGVATFTNLSITGTAGARTLSFTSVPLTAATSASVNVSAGVASKLVMVTNPAASVQVGAALGTVAVQLQDASSNNVTTIGVPVAIAISSGGSLQGTLTTTTDGSGIATFTGLVVRGATGTRTVSFSSGSLTIATSTSFSVTTGTPASLIFATTPSPTPQVGVPFPVPAAVQLADVDGNPVLNAGTPITVAINSGPGALGGTLVVNTNASGVATFTDLTVIGNLTPRTLRFTQGVFTPLVSGNVTPTVGPAATLVFATAPGAAAINGTNLPTQPVINALDPGGNISTITSGTMTASVISGSGSVTNNAVAISSGVATFGTLRLTGTIGAFTLQFTDGTLTLSSGSITLGVGAADTLRVIGSAAIADTATAQKALTAIVVDAGSNPVSGTTVTFNAPSGGTRSPVSAVSAGNGQVSTTWTLGTLVGTQTLVATIPGGSVTTRTWTATVSNGNASQIAINAGNAQSATAGSAVTIAPSVIVKDAYNNPVNGVSVTFAIATGGGSLTGASTSTNASGVATVGSWTLGTTAGANSISATSAGLTGSPLTITATGTAGVATQIAINAGNAQTATAGSAVTTAPSVIVKDVNNNPVSGTSVTFAVATGGGAVVGGSATTNASGIATVTSWTLGTTAGSNTLTATSTGLTGSPLTFTATGTAGAATQIAVNAGNAQTATAGSAVAIAPSVIVKDVNNNLVSGTSVTFVVATGGGAVVGGSATTNASGVATVTSWTLGTTAGSNTLTATSTGLTGSPLTFTATGLVGAATQIAINTGNNGTATAGSTVPAPSVIVKDVNNNPVSGVSVTFAIATGGGSITGASTSTNASGVATVGSWTLGTTAGSNTLTATSGSLTGSPLTITATGTAGAATQIAINLGNAQTATAGSAVTTAPSVIVKDVNNNPVSGTSVTFAVATGGGSVVGGSATTNASGIATVTSWTLGATAGSNSLTATSGSLTGSPLTFTATGIAGAATQIAINAGNGQSATVGTAVGTLPSVIVKDVNNNPVSGTSVTFAVATGGGSLTGGSATTNASGIATVGSWTLGTSAGSNTLTATSGTLIGSPVTFTATGTAGAATQIAINAGNAQTATAGSAVATAPSVIVKDASNNPVAGTSVTFAVATGGGAVVGGSATTNASGIATVTSWTLGTTVGANSLTATSGSLTGSPLTFTATGIAGAATQIAVNAGNAQSATAGSAVATAPSVIVKDVNNNPVSGVSVTFAAATGGGSVTGGSATTNAGGIATVGSWTLGTTAGSNTLTATSGTLTGSPVTITATGTAGAATQIAINAGNAQTAAVATAVSTAPSVIVRDVNNNPVSGVSVTFAAATGGGSVTGGSATTNASGIATVGSWTMGNTAGANTMTATSGSLTGSPVTFSATGVAGAADVLSKNAGDAQTGTVGGTLGSSIEVKVVDSHNNPKSGVVVTFTPAGGSGSVGSPTATTDVNGLASVTWTLGTTAGAQSVTATMPSGTTASVTFNATANAGAADVLSKNGGDAQTGTVGGLLGSSLEVRVVDSFGNAKSGVVVTFTPAGGSGSVSSPTATTDVNGLATVNWTLGTTSGAQSVTATMPSGTTASVTFNATANPDVPASITVNTDPVPNGAGNGSFATQPVITVKDQYGNAVGAGITVTATLNPILTATGTLTGTPNPSTGANGQITFSLGLAGATSGDNYTITFSIGGITAQTLPFNVP